VRPASICRGDRPAHGVNQFAAGCSCCAESDEGFEAWVAPQAFFSTDTTLAPEEIIAIFVRRWQVEVTFSEVRAHLGVETQRQWSDRAISRTTPALLGLYSLIVLWAEDLLRRGAASYAAAWYRKDAFTFTDAIAAVRRRIWIGDISDPCPHDRYMPKIPPDRLIRMADALCFAA
jgi:hypothetical protein